MFPFGWKRITGFLRKLWLPRKASTKTDERAGKTRRSVIVSSSELQDAVSGRVDNLDENLKKRIRHLGEAINQSLSDSEPIANAIADIKASGYDIFLVLEATIGFTQQGDESDRTAMVAASSGAQEPEFRVTPQDKKFLKSLRIRLDE